MQSIYPSLRYRDAPAAIDWLCTAFGFERHQVYEEDSVVQHAELRFRGGIVMLGSERPGDLERGFGQPAGQSWLYVVVDDPDAHYQRSRDAGAEIVRELENQEYGSRDYSARDPEGNLWSFGTYDPSAG
jgi:uncharacterized glyoxalase superfamily protein PhnB